jgi:threonylcarbamoyladenosine tRNA methylthiotransferase CDKAL1
MGLHSHDIEDLAPDVASSGHEVPEDGGREQQQERAALLPLPLAPRPQRRRRPRQLGSGSDDNNNGDNDNSDGDLDALADEAVGTVPGTARVWIRTMGCAHNAADSEQIAGVLMAQGYRVALEGAAAAAAANADSAANASAKDDADVWLLNSCTVKDPSEQAVGTFVREAAARGKAVVVAGCVPQAQKTARVLQPPPLPPPLPTTTDSNNDDGHDQTTKNSHHRRRPIAVGLLGVAQLARAAEVVEAAVRGESLALLGRGRGERALPDAELPQARRNPHVAIVPLSQGCLGACTYCKTVHARGALSSYAPEQIEARVVKAARDPRVREIHLSSEDVGAYGRDRGTSLAALLERLTGALDRVAREHGQVEEEAEEVEEMEEEDNKGGGDDKGTPSSRLSLPRPRRPLHRVRLRVGMSNPPFLLRDGALDAVSKTLLHPAAFRWLHLPVQSADDGVLTKMNREYTVQDFEDVVDGLTSRVPGLAIATDVIVGFPGEDDEAFERTLELLRRRRFPSVHCTRFYPRPGTPAARYRPRVPTGVQKLRSAAAAAVIEGRDLMLGAKEAGAEKGAAWGWSPYRGMVGTVQRVAVVDVASDGVSLVAHAFNYAQVLLAPAPGLMGAVADVRVVSASRWSVRGEVVRVLYAPLAAGEAVAEAEGGEEQQPREEQGGGALSAAEAAAAARARVRAAREERAKKAAATAAAQGEEDVVGGPERDQRQHKQEQQQEQHQPKQQPPAPQAPATTLPPPLLLSDESDTTTTTTTTSSRLAPCLVSAGLLLLAAAMLLLGATTLRDLGRLSVSAAAR